MNAKSAFCRLLLGTSALTFAFASPVAFAQQATSPGANAEAEDDASEDEDIIVVTGIRGALQNAAQIKRNASTFVDSITASDVSALPDNSVAEALGRIPGVSVTRYSILPQYNEGGAGGASADFPSAEGAGNLIRGLSFVRSEFNGRDQFTANGGRALDWSSIPPELVSGVDVYKNASAELIEGGIGGTINLRTREPFDQAGSLLGITGDATYSDLREELTPSYSVVASNRWETGAGEFGLMGSYSRSELSSLIHDWQQGSPIPRVNLNTVDLRGPTKFIGVPESEIVGAQQVFQLRNNEQDRERESYYLAGQWENNTTRVTAKYVRVDNGVDTVEHTVEYLPDGNTPTSTLISGTLPTLGATPSTLGSLSAPTTVPYSGTVPLCNIAGGDGEITCGQPIAIGSIMTEGWLTSSGADAGSAYGYPINTLGRGVVEESTTEDISLNIQHDFTDQLHLSLDVHRTTADASLIEQWSIGRTYFMVRERTSLSDPEVEFVMDPRGNAITNLFAGQSPQGNITDTSNPGAYLWLAGNDNAQRGTGELTAYRADLEYEFAGDSWFQTLKFGARYSERSQINDQSNQNWSPVTPPWSGDGVALFSTLSSTPGLIEVQDYSNFFRGGVVQGPNTGFVYIGREYLLDINKMSALFVSNPGGMLAQSGWQPRGARYPEDRRSDVSEETKNAYVQLDFGHEFGNGMSIEGNIGVRYTQTDLNSAGSLVYNEFAAEPECTPGPGTIPTTEPDEVAPGDPGACGRNSPQDFLPETTAYLLQASVPISTTQSDEHYLPSFNVKWNLNDEMLIRFGFSENLTRPNIADMRAYSTRGASTGTLNWPDDHCTTPPLNYPTPPGCNDGVQNISLNGISATGGNPRLRPTTSTNYDLSYEWYFEGGYFSAAVFKKEITDLISGGSESLGDITLDGVTVPITYTGQINTRSVDVSGFEIAYQQFYDFLPGPLSNLGLQANYTYIDASAEPDSDCVNNNEPCRFGITKLFGVSENLANIVGIYQDQKFQARLAYSWRDEFLLVKGDYMTGNPTFNKPEGILDGSVSYNFNERLQFRGSVSNILDTRTEAEMQVDQEGNRLDRFSILRDRRFVFGFRYQY